MYMFLLIMIAVVGGIIDAVRALYRWLLFRSHPWYPDAGPSEFGAAPLFRVALVLALSGVFTVRALTVDPSVVGFVVTVGLFAVLVGSVIGAVLAIRARCS